MTSRQLVCLLLIGVLLCSVLTEHFGADHVTSGDEEKKTEEKEMDSEDDDRKLGGTPTPTQTPMKMNTE